jgi:hypothetical protein
MFSPMREESDELAALTGSSVRGYFSVTSRFRRIPSNVRKGRMGISPATLAGSFISVSLQGLSD